MTPNALPSNVRSSNESAIIWADTQREASFDQWLDTLQTDQQLLRSTLRLASSDASFRRYFRIDSLRGSRIIMDAPPDKENCKPFVHVAGLMRDAGLNVPAILNWDEIRGFMLLSDLGQQTLMQIIDPVDPVANLNRYLQAIEVLVTWQLASKPGVLAEYDEALLRRELELFPQWYLERYRNVRVDGALRQTLDQAFELIVAQNLRWPRVFVHRDFMPRNLMVSDSSTEQSLGVLDFQDAVYGPITYDIASLMRDAFLSWDEEFVLEVTIRYWQRARATGLPVDPDFGEFYRGVEWMGLQRHLKVAGIFARLTLRDGKPRYLEDAPRFIRYIRSCAVRYRELKPLLRLIDQIEGLTEATGFAYGRI